MNSNSLINMKTIKAIQTLTLLFLMWLPLAVTAQKTTEVREVSDFTGINASSIFNIELTQGDVYLLEIIADEAELSQVKSDVKKDILHLEYKGSGRRINKIDARITMPMVQSIELSGAVSLRGKNTLTSEELMLKLSGASSATLSLESQKLESQISGAVHLTLSGIVDTHRASVGGASHLKARQLQTQNTYAKVSGASHAQVKAEEYLDVQSSGTSRVTYAREPKNKKIVASGMSSINEVRAMDMPGRSVNHADTTRIRLGGRDLLIIEDDIIPRVRTSSRRGRFRSNWSGFELGINGYLSPNHSFTLEDDAEYIDLRYNKSVIVNLNLWQQSFPISQNFGFVSGVGFSWNNYRFDNQTRIVHDNSGLIFYEDTLNKMRKNKLTLTWVTIPVLFEYQTRSYARSERFHLAGGLILGTRIGTHTKYVYDDKGKKRKEKDFNDFNVPPFRFDLTGRIGWGRVNLFATYSLNGLFKDNKGPELYPFSVGIRLVNW